MRVKKQTVEFNAAPVALNSTEFFVVASKSVWKNSGAPVPLFVLLSLKATRYVMASHMPKRKLSLSVVSA